jgi:heat shock protein HtpX
VLAHEFGHYHGGDTRLGPWVYKTRAAIGRTLAGLAAHSSVLQKPFIWYGSLFLRVSHGVSRRQELTADELAASTVGSQPLIDGLKKIHGAAALVGSYWSAKVMPVVRAGFLPPLADGFRQFVATPAMAAVASQSVEQAFTESDEDPYDTHPPLKERVEAVRLLPAGAPSSDDGPAIDLLAGIRQLEGDLARPWAGFLSGPLAPISWEDVGGKVYAPTWAATRPRYDAHLAAVAIEDLAERLPALVERLVPGVLAENQDISPEDAVQAVVWGLGATLADALTRLGWSIRANVGEPIVLQGPSGAIGPFRTVHAMASKQLAPADWQRQCADLGLAGTPLGGGRADPET